MEYFTHQGDVYQVFNKVTFATCYFTNAHLLARFLIRNGGNWYPRILGIN